MMKQDIFVQIPAYRDQQTLPTIKDALAKAKNPDLLTFGLCWQYMPGEDESMLPRSSVPGQVRMLTVPALESKGVCWARHKVQALYAGETYTLSIDSHTRFTTGWDEELIKEFHQCQNPRAVLTSYPAPYTLENGPDTNAAPTYLAAAEYLDAGLPRFRSLHREDKLERPIRGLFVAAGFYFASGKMIEEVPVDPYLYFNQEEILLAARLWTHGYDVYSPAKNLVYHLFNTDLTDPARRQLHTDDHTHWGRLHEMAHERAHHILGTKKSINPKVLCEIDKYDLGTVRSLDEFIHLSGIDFKSSEVSQRAHAGEFIADLNPWINKNKEAVS